MKLTILSLLAVLAVPGLLPAQVESPPRPATSPGVLGISAAGGSFTPSISADGRFVVFVSQANNLVTNDNNSPFLDIFVRDLVTGTTKLVSVNRFGTGGGDGDSNFPMISSHGQFIAFESTAANLVDDDTNGVSDVFVRDMVSGTTILVSVNQDGTAPGNGPSSAPVITPDGFSVIFESAASNLVDADTNGLSDLFVRDLWTETTSLVSVGAIGTTGNRAESAAITPDGRRVVFASSATGLVPSIAKTLGEIYVRDLDQEVTYCASTNVTSLVGYFHRCLNPVISGDGRIVVFKVVTNQYPVSLAPVFVCRHDLDTGTTTVLATNSLELTWPAVSADGRYVAYENQGVCGVELLRYDAQSGTNILVSVDLTSTNAGAGDASTPVMKSDGSGIAFLFAYIPRDSAFCLGGPLTTNFINDKGQLYYRDLVAQTTRLISVHPDGTPGNSSLANIVPSLSDTASKIVFESLDPNLVSQDRNQASDIFVYPLSSGKVELVSQSHPARPPQTSLGLNYLCPNSLSADGRLVVFSSLDGNVTPDDTNGLPDIFVRDLATGSNTLVSVRTNTTVPMLGQARDPVISANGQYVAFVLTKTPSTLHRSDIFLRDLAHESTTVVNTWDGTNATGSFSCPSLSADGQLLAFNSENQVYVRDNHTGSNIFVSVNWTGTNAGDGISRNPLISPNGRWVVFESKAANLTTNLVDTSYFQLYARDQIFNRTVLLNPPSSANHRAVAFIPASFLVLFTDDSGKAYIGDLLAQTNRMICLTCANPVISAYGRIVAFEEKNTLSNLTQIAVQELPSGATKLITSDMAHPEMGNSHSVCPLLTYDGRYVIFASKASDLVPNDTNGYSDIFVHDLVLGQTLLVSVNSNGIPAQGTSARPVLGADGQSVLFQSFAPDLVSGDYNFSRDIFVLRLRAGDSDEDNLPDDWELAYFGTLARDGSGDLDGDGMTDAQEYLAGTDPTNQGSVLRAITVTSAGTGAVTVLWSAVPGRTYIVNYKTNVTDSAWTELPGAVLATSSTATKLDSTAGANAHRFYRVILQQ